MLPIVIDRKYDMTKNPRSEHVSGKPDWPVVSRGVGGVHTCCIMHDAHHREPDRNFPDPIRSLNFEEEIRTWRVSPSRLEFGVVVYISPCTHASAVQRLDILKV